MSRKIDLEIKNREVIKSLIYSLERRFSDYEFSYDENLGLLELKPIGEKSEDKSKDSYEGITQFIFEFLVKFKRMDKKLKIETVFENKLVNKRPININSFKEEIEKTKVDGTFWIDSKLFNIYKLIDTIFVHFAKSVNAKEIYAPSLISEEDLSTCGYLPKELHQVSFLSQKDIEGNISSGHICLSPAACLTTYPTLRNKTLNETSMAFTLLGNVFRHEGGKFSTSEYPFERMWEYQVRELIFFGNSQYKEEIKNKYFEFLKYLGKALDFSFEISTASDLFFHTEYNSALAHQLLTKSKFEFVLLDHNRLALSSFNIHGDQFTKAFNIKNNAHDFQSFCIGFGIQRFLQGIMLSHQDIDQATVKLKQIQKELMSDEQSK
jgi:hypothetical protein